MPRVQKQARSLCVLGVTNFDGAKQRTPSSSILSYREACPERGFTVGPPKNLFEVKFTGFPTVFHTNLFQYINLPRLIKIVDL